MGKQKQLIAKIEMKNGILRINQNGRRTWKWQFTDKYRFQNKEFYLGNY